MKRIAIALLALLAAGCAGTKEATVRTYDFGLEAPAASLSGLRPGSVRASAPFDTTDMLYRLAFRNPAELLAFAESRWAATPSVLLQRRFMRASTGVSAPCSLDFELSELSQAFTSPAESEVVLEGRAILVQGTRRAGERVFRSVAGGAGGSAVDGVRATTRAADKLIADVAAWSATVSACTKG